MKHLFNLKKRFISVLGLVLLLTFQLFSVQSAHATTCAAAIVLNPAALPVNQALVCGTTNDVTSASFGITTSTLYVGGLESLYRLTPTITGSYTISYTGQSWSSINVFNGCPTTAGTTGVGGIASSATTKSVTVTLTAGVIYYIMFDTWPTPASPCAGTFTIVGPPMVPTTGNNTYSSCSGTIYDNGGATGNYANNSNGFSVINPATAGNNVQISGTISTESGWDFVRIYNGVGIGGTLLWSGSGSLTVPLITSTTGPLTVQFTSDGTVNSSGFALTYSCVPAACSGIPNAGTATISSPSGCVGASLTLSATGLTISGGIAYQWQSSPNGTTWTNIPGATAATYVFTSVSGLTYYRLTTTCSNSVSSASTNVVSYNGNITNNCSCLAYGASSATTTADEEILNVTLGTLNNSSNCSTLAGGSGSITNRYSNYTGIVTAPDLMQGVAYPMSLTLGYCGTYAYSNVASVYIDFNQNGSFADAGENVFNTSYGARALTGSVVTGNVTVPAGATLGITRMRIVYNESSTAPATGTYSYGETEDYCVNIISPPTTPPINASTFTNCASGVTLTASSSAPTNVAYYWQTSATGTSTANGAASFVVYGNGTYFLRAINTLYNVWGVATSITVTAFPTITLPTPIIVSSPSCPSASLTMASAPLGVNYYWQGTNNAGFSTANNATAAYTANTTGTYYVRAQDSNGCWSDNVSALVTIYAAPNATASFVAPTTCGTNGQIVFNVQGSGTVFLSDFSTPNLPAGTVSAGNDFNPSVNGRMQLTSAAGSKNGGVVIPNNTGIASNDFQIDFDFVTISAGVAAADGFSYSYGPDVVALPDQTAVQTGIGAAPATGVTTLCPENGSGTGLKLAFDAYSNTGGCPVANGTTATLPNTSIGNSPGVYLMYNSTSLHQGSSCPGVLYYSNNTSWVASGVSGTVTSTHVTIKINAAGQVSMWQNGVQVVNNVSLGAGYLAADKSTWKHAFTARTGGLWEGHYIDNLDIHYNLYEYSIDNGATWTTQNPIPVPIGMYQTKVRYAGVTNGCETSATIGLASNGAVNIGSALIAGSATANICSGTTFTVMAVNLPNAGGGFTYQWQSSSDNGVTWSNVGTQMLAYMDLVTSATQNTKYRLQIICPTVTTYTSIATVTIYQTPVFTLSASNNGIWCDNYTGAQTITASNSSITYAWSPASSLNAATGQTVTSTAPGTTQSTYTVVGTNVAGCSSTQTISVGLPFINVTFNVANFCGTGGAAVLTASTNAGANATFSWSNLSPSTATLVANGANANVSITATSNFQVSIDSYNGNQGCASVGNYSLGVYPLPLATVTTSASGVCPGTSAVINSGLSSGNFSAVCTPFVNYPAPSNATYLANTGVATVPLQSGSLDDGGWSGIPLGFNFNFFGTSFNTINVGTNGVLQFGAYNATALGDYTIGALPNTVDPLGAIYICANDLVEYNTNNYVRYWTDGFAPNRRFIIEYYASQFGNAANNVRAKAILYETIGVVDIQGIEIMSTNSKSIGVNNATGTVGAAAPNCPANTQNYWSGQTATIPAASPQAWRFTPPANYNTTWTATAGGNSTVVANGTNIFTLNVSPAVTTTYSISYTNQTTGCTNAPGSAQVTMAVLGVNAPTGVAALTSNALVCPGDPFTLSTNYTGIVDGLTYQWQSAPSASGPWTNIVGATASTSIQNMTATLYYRCNIQSCGGTAVPTAAVVVTYNTNCIAVPASGNNSITTCNGVIFDNGGLTGPYAASSNGYTVIYPATTGYMVQIQGTQYTESSYDYLQVYNGVGTTGTQLYNFSGSANVGPITSTTGPLTVNFYADGIIQYDGFSLTSTCVPPSPLVTSNLTNGNLCIGGSTTLTATLSSQLPSNFSGTVYWFAGSCGTTGQVGTGLTLNVSPTVTTTYYARLFDGAIWSACQPYTVIVNPYPVVNAGPDVSICAGTSTQLNGTATLATSNVVQVGTSTAATTNYPFRTFYHDAKTQFILTASELLASGVTTGNINSIAFNVTTATPYDMNGFNISLKNTTVSTLTGYETGLTNVYSGIYSVPATGWQTINFQTPFAWDGTSNLVIQICFDNGAYLTDSYVDARTTSTNSMAYYYADNDAGCAFTTSYLQAIVPIVKLGVDPTLTKVWTPSAGLSATTILNPVATPTATTNYTLTVTSAVGCATTDQVVVTVQNLPVVTIANQTVSTFCNGGSVVLAPTPTAQNYAWTQGTTAVGTGSTYTATTSGVYSLVVTNFYPSSGISCSSLPSNPITVTVNPNPNATITPAGSTTICQGASVSLAAGATNSTPVSYLWSNGSSTANFVATLPGTLTVNVTNNFGCTATSAPVTVSVLPLPVATITAGGSTTFCAGGSVGLTASSGTSYLWSGNNATTQTINPTTAGNYSVTVTGANGCTATSSPIAVDVLPAPANAQIAGPSTICLGNPTNFTNPVSNGIWSSSNAGVMNINANTGSALASSVGTATISYTTTGSNGCTSVQTANVSVTGSPVATITTSASPSICQGSTVTLTANPAQSYLWNNNATTQSITVSSGGSYTVSVSNGPGCSSAVSAPTVVTVHQLPLAQITANGSTVFCQGGSVNLTASGGTSYVWNNQSSASVITANASGTYSVTVTDAFGCQATSNVVNVTVNPLPTTNITASGPTTFCQGGNVTLSASGNGIITWSNNATAPSIVVSTPGNITYTYTDMNGCTATSAPTAIVVNPVPVVPAIIGTNNVCANATTPFSNTLTGGVWSSSNASIASVNAAGLISGVSNGAATISYQVTQNGCSATTTKMINVLAAPIATITPLGATTFCQGSSVSLMASPGTQYSWSTNETTQVITVTTASLPTVTVTGSNGCSATSLPQTITVNTATNLAPITLVAPICLGSTANASTTIGGGTWSCANPNVAQINPTTGAYIGNASGTTNILYTYTNVNGCTSVQTAQVVVEPLPLATTSVSGSTVFCEGNSIVITAPSAPVYNWSNGATTQSIVVNTSGSYHVDITNGVCTATSPTTIVTVYSNPVPTITSTSSAICQGGSVTLTASPAATYAWSNGATTQSINVSSAGSYGVTATNAYGCTNSSAPLAISVSALPSAYIAANGPTTFCNGSSVGLSANAGGSSYLWSNNATTQNITATTSGTYFVTITNAAGCSAVSNEITVSAQQTFTATATAVGPTAVCDGAFVTLVASPGASYLWTPGGATTQGINAGVNGNYHVTVTNALGCTSTSSNVQVTVLPVPTAGITASGSTTFCEGGSVVLTGTGGNSYVWNSNINGPTVTATQGGTYVVTAYAANGCSDAAEVVVTVNESPSPTLQLNGNTILCPGESLVISAQPNNGYAWSNNATTQSITVTSPGTYEAVLTGLNGCTTNSDVINVTAGSATSSTINATGYASYTLNEVVYTQSGTYTQTLTNAAGCDSTITLNLTLTVGIEEGNISDVNLYPNPTSESFTIKTSSPLYGTYSIVDAQGKLVFSGEMTGTDTQVNISSVARGIYYLRIPELSEPLRVVKN